MSAKYNPCTLCGKPGIPGLIRGSGKCQYHWNAGTFGKAWADKCAAEPDEQHDWESRHVAGLVRCSDPRACLYAHCQAVTP